tara:strand:- start:1266 stop:1577 length:312 start_codon:yes stop_codon:yes gene_type:complete
MTYEAHIEDEEVETYCSYCDELSHNGSDAYCSETCYNMAEFGNEEGLEMKVWGRWEFITFLEETLIPDLKRSGNHSTAEDFETAVFFMSSTLLQRQFERRNDI